MAESGASWEGGAIEELGDVMAQPLRRREEYIQRPCLPIQS